MKYVLILCAFLAVWGLFNQYRVNYAQTQITTLQGEKKELVTEKNELIAEKNELIAEIERRENDIVEISKRKRELEKAISDDKSGFDWSYRIGNSVPIKRLQKQCVSCPTRAD